MIECQGASPANEPSSSKSISATTIAAIRPPAGSSVAAGGDPFLVSAPKACQFPVYPVFRQEPVDLCRCRGASPASRRNHEDKLLGSASGRRLTACGCRLRPGKENQAVGPSACCRKDGSGAECGSHHSRILDRKRKGPNPLRSGNDGQRP